MADNALKEKDAYLLTLSDIFFAPITTPGTATTAPEYDTNIYRKQIGKKVEVKGNGKATEIYASGVKVATVNQETNIETTMDYIGLATYVLDLISGAKATNGVSFASSDAGVATEFGFGFTARKSDGVMDGYWFPRTTLAPATELSYETSEDEFKEQDVSMTLQSTGLLNPASDGRHIIFAKYSNQRETTLTLDDFMKQVVYDESQLATLVGSGTTPAAGHGSGTQG